MADELIQAGIFEGMTWWNTNPAKNLFTTGVLSPPPYCSIAVGGEGLVASWAVGEHQITNNMGVPCRSTAPNLFDEDPYMTLQVMGFDADAWNHQHIINGGSSEEGDYPTTTTTSDGGGGDLHCSSSTAVTCDGQIPVVKRLLVLDCDSGTQPLASSINQQQQIINHIRATLLGGSPCSSLPSSPKPQSQNKVNRNEECCDSGSFALRNGAEPMFKRQRIETPSSLPTFKVRKEKLGDRITALQQLVSPFGKTDTASVLHEAIEYIKFLHDQLHGLISTPYMKNGAPIQHHHHQQGNHNQRSKSEGEVATQDLRSRGLCLVPISSTFPVAHETPADFWTPTFGATFR